MSSWGLQDASASKISNTFLNVLSSSVLGRVAALLFVLYLANTLPQEFYADIMLLYGSMMAYTWIFSIGLPVYIVPNKRFLNGAYSFGTDTIIIGTITASVGSLFMVFQFMNFFELSVDTLTIIIISATIVPNTLIRIFASHLQAAGKIKISSRIQFLLRNILILALCSISYLIFEEIIFIALAIFITHIFLILIYLLIISFSNFKIIRKSLNSGWIKHCWQIMISGASFQLLMMGPSWASTKLETIEYAFIVTITALLSQGFMVLTSLSSTIYPLFSKLEDGMGKKNISIFFTASKLNSFLTTVFLFGAFFILEYFLMLFDEGSNDYFNQSFIVFSSIVLYFLKGPINTFLAAQKMFIYEALFFTFGLLVFWCWILLNNTLNATIISQGIVISFISISFLEIFCFAKIVGENVYSRSQIVLCLILLCFIIFLGWF